MKEDYLSEGTSVLSELMIRYPFSPQSRRSFEKLPIEEGFSSPAVVAQAEDRLLDSLGKLSSLKNKRYERHQSDEIEFSTFFVAALVASQDANLALRFSGKEADKAKGFFLREAVEKKPAILQECYGFRLLYAKDDGSEYQFQSTIEDYLASTVRYELHKLERWKLVNQTVSNGTVHFTDNSVNDLFRDLAARLVNEGVKNLRRGTFPKQLTALREKILPYLPAPKLRSGRGYLYVEELLKHPVSDGRHRMIWLILSPWCMNVRKLEEEEAIERIRNYVSKTGETRELKRFIEYNVRRAKRNGLMPPTLNKLKNEHPDLYALLPQEVLKAYSLRS